MPPVLGCAAGEGSIQWAATSLTSRCRQIDEVTRYAHLLVRAAAGKLVRLEVEDGVAHLVIRKVK
jgi:hypothetical protein